MNPKVDGYLKRAKKWQEEMRRLRSIVLASELTEELKWGKPCYTLEGKNVVLIIAFKEYCALLFCKGALLKDAHGILVKPGENTQAARQIRFTSVGQIVTLERALKAHIKEAIEVEKAGLDVDYKKSAELVLPDELLKNFAKNPALKTAFAALTPGRQRGYVIYFSAAKQSKTREARIEKYARLILAGKGMND
ncbi:MAG TPA: DUF1801 domain-containing protein [Verrucomicrobiae bacterium]|nr:DUF1801 domain-containing protein [Verrucomicrobiae bacterium]